MSNVGFCDWINGSKTIFVPVIQRDYCMGNFIFDSTGPIGLLKYIIDEFNCNPNDDLILSAITVYEINDSIHLYDGQQRVVTLFGMLKCLMEINKSSNKICLEFENRKTMTDYLNNPNTNESSYGVEAFKTCIKKIGNYLSSSQINSQNFERYIIDKIKFAKISVNKEFSIAEQFFIDINSGVPLVPYEIFKCLINARAEQLGISNEWFKKIDNEWLDIFYNIENPSLNYESEREELLEIRFIEFCAKMIYLEKKINNISSKVVSDDDKKKCISEVFEMKNFRNSKNAKEIMDANKYIESLDKNDFDLIKDIMNAISNMSFNSIDSINTEFYFDGKTVCDWTLGNLYYGNSTNYEKYIKVFIKSLMQDEYEDERNKDFLIWAILKNKAGINVDINDIKNHLNTIKIDYNIAYMTVQDLARWDEVLYPIPKYYYKNYNNGSSIYNLISENDKKKVNGWTKLYDIIISINSNGISNQKFSIINLNQKNIWANWSLTCGGIPITSASILVDSGKNPKDYRVYYRYKGNRWKELGEYYVYRVKGDDNSKYFCISSKGYLYFCNENINDSKNFLKDIKGDLKLDYTNNRVQVNNSLYLK